MSGLTTFQPTWLVRVTLILRNGNRHDTTARWTVNEGAVISKQALARRGIDCKKVREVRSWVGNRLTFTFCDKL